MAKERGKTNKFQSVPVHRILPTIRRYGSGKKTYHVELWKQCKMNSLFCKISGKKSEYCFDVPDEESMYKLADTLKTLLNISTDAQIIINETCGEFILHSKPKKISAGYYIYRGYTIYDKGYNSKDWWLVKGECDDGRLEEIYLSSPELLGRYGTLKFAMENVDILVDGETR